MAFTDNKITTADLNGKGVTGLPDAPELSTEAMQKKFDELSTDVIVPHFNDLCDYLNANVPGITLPETPVDGDMLVYDSASSAFVFVQKATTLANLKDVDMTGLVNGMYLRYDFPTRSWKATNSSTSVPALDDINDVSITDATNGQCLIYKDGTWKNDNEKLDNLKNVYIHLPQNKQLLAYDAANGRWTNVELDGGGHKILNASGTQLAQEEYLQFGGLLKATDENGKTVVTDEAEDMSFADWDALSEEQKAEYSAGKKLNILDPPDCDGEVEIENMHLAWKNPNPTSAFAAQNITLNTDDYDGYVWIAKVLGADVNTIGLKGDDVFLTASNGSNNYGRYVTRNSDVSFSVADATVNGTTSNNQLIPLAVYTYKNDLTAKVNVLATNVKATVDYSTSEHKIGKWIDGSDLYEKTIDCGTLPNASQKLVFHNISNFKRCVDLRGYTYTTHGNTMVLPIATTAMFVRIDVEPTKLNIVDNVDMSDCKETYITIRYTKTS